MTPPSASAAATPPHILVIDDDPSLRALFAEMLGDEGHRVSTHDRADVDLDAFAALAPDLLILDYQGDAGSTGWALLERLRAESAFAALPVLLCTTAHEQMRALALQLVALRARVVLKPFDIDDLLGAVNDLLGARLSTPPIRCSGV